MSTRRLLEETTRKSISKRALREWLDDKIEKMTTIENGAEAPRTDEPGDIENLVVTAARLVEAIAQALPIDEEADAIMSRRTEEIVSRRPTRPLVRQ